MRKFKFASPQTYTVTTTSGTCLSASDVTACSYIRVTNNGSNPVFLNFGGVAEINKGMTVISKEYIVFDKKLFPIDTYITAISASGGEVLSIVRAN
jgi:hypothetical protein